ncbi:FKBP-type peptidyl-prolyl cis-trans isomerase [Microbacterium sp. P06]|uniref:FKBP-type peptidyl-prolyl cis-trans isomerase n=1 Tax=unclassified Microbacterium TaxID=2609290 RepID=UPI003745B95A
MRFRPLASLSVAAAAVLLIAGCSASTPDATETTSEAPVSGCESQLKSGAESDSIEVAGDFAAEPSVTIPDGFAPAGLERSTVIEGDGDAIGQNEVLEANFTLIDVATGEVQLETLSSDPDGMDTLVNPQQIFGAALECARVGTRTVSVFPDGALGEGSAAFVLVADALAKLPVRASGAEVAPVDGMPTVELSDDGAPTITIPEGEAPTEVKLENLIQGDGDTVAPGDQVIVQYTGVKYSDGSVFDSSWDRGAPTQFGTDGVVDGFRQALEGQQVGSQVVVVIPPAFGYGADATSELQNETLVFVVDILGVQHAAAA